MNKKYKLISVNNNNNKLMRIQKNNRILLQIYLKVYG